MAVNLPGRILPEMELSLVLLLVIITMYLKLIATGAVRAMDSSSELDFFELTAPSLIFACIMRFELFSFALVSF